ncbi:MAG: META domain-containing protein [Rhodobacteraceae bacterium]|nr:META domain-containing protein [Paracoccaceae bacterium]
MMETPMRKMILTLTAAMALTACVTRTAGADEIASGEWFLLALDGTRFSAEASLAFDAAGGVHGKAPCNRYSGPNGATLPAVDLSRLASTRMACPALAEENLYLQALAVMTAAELRDGHLLLTGPDGRRAEFVRDPGDKALVCLTCDG